MVLRRARVVGWGVALLLVATLARAAASPDLSTPRRTLELFIDACRAGHPGQAAQALDLSMVPAAKREARGALLAKELKFVLDRKLWVSWDRIPDAPGATSPLLVGTIPLPTGAVPVTLDRDAQARWRVSAATVAEIPALYEIYGAGFLERRLPDTFFGARFLEIEVWQWLGLVVLLALALGGGTLLAKVGIGIGRKVARRTETKWDDALLEALTPPGHYLLGGALFAALDGLLKLAAPAQHAVDQIVRTELLIAATWLLMRFTGTAAAVLEARFTAAREPPHARAVKTQIEILRRVVAVAVVVLGTALVLMQFSIVRSLGTSLLASAGIAGIVFGLAAQRTISTLLAGIQLSITQPMRIGDTVIVENEWGWIEEITLTYVVVRVWDERRLVVPVTRFLDQPFQNWTKVAPQIMGTIFLYADYSVPVQRVREELERIVKADPLWDGRVVGLQVTDASERTVTLRALVSSADAGANWDLRCNVREKLLAYLHDLDHGRFLPRTRLQPHEAAATLTDGAAA